MKRPTTKSSNALLASLKILNSILDDESPLTSHIVLNDNWAIANNSVLAIGEKIIETLTAAPNAHLLEQALAKCGNSISITQLEHKLSIKSEKFRALVPCLPFENMPRTFPDAPVAQLDDRLKASILAVSSLALEGASSVVTASLLISDGCVTATDRNVMLQSYHANNTPTFALPKSIIAPLNKTTKKLTQFGFSNNSCTFYFEDDSWLKSQFYAAEWPDVNRILNRPFNAWPLPEDFYKAVKSLEPFSEDGCIYFDSGKMLSHPDEALGASYEIYGLPKGPIFNIKQLKMIEPYVQKIDFMAEGPNGKMLMFTGNNIRGAIAGRVS